MTLFFGPASLGHLGTCHANLNTVARYAILHTPYDFSIIEGKRSTERQQQLFADGLTEMDGIIKKGKHQADPLSRAFDFVPYPEVMHGVNVWKEKINTQRWCLVAGIIMSAGMACGIPLIWGGDWNSDSSNADQKFHDLGHIELK